MIDQQHQTPQSLNNQSVSTGTSVDGFAASSDLRPPDGAHIEVSVGVVLRGGGVKGLALLGAVAELERALRIQPTAYGGTSAGGLLAIALASGYSADQLIPALRNQSFLDFLDSDWQPDTYLEPWASVASHRTPSFLLSFVAGFLRLATGALGLRTRGGMYSSESVGRWVMHLLRWRPRAGILPPEPDIQVDTRLGTFPCGVLTVASSTAPQNCVIHSSNTTPDFDACLAARCTMSIPGVFHPIPLGGDLLMDGGLVANFPLAQFSATFPTTRTIGVFLCDAESSARGRDWTTSPLGIVKASLAIFLGQDELQIVREHKASVVWIDVNPIQTLDFDLSDEDKTLLLECGRVGALRWLRENKTDPIVRQEFVPTDQDFAQHTERLRDMRFAARQRWKIRHRNRRLLLTFASIMPVLLVIALLLGGGVALSRLHPGVTNHGANSGDIQRRVLNVAVVLNGEAEYTATAERAFREKLADGLKHTVFVPRVEVAIGRPESNSDNENRRIFDELLGRFDSTPDYLVTVGTQVSVFAKKNYLGRIPLVFIAVTDPIDAGLVRNFEPDRARGNIGGVAYADILGGVRLLERAFPDARIGFYYSSKIPQDQRVATMLAASCPEVTRIDDMRSPPATSMNNIDLLFGWYYFSRNFLVIRQKFPGAMVAGNEADMTRGAVAMLANNDLDAGSLAATRVLLPTVLQGVILADEPILRVSSHRFAVNRKIARHHGLALANRLPAGTVEYE